jgi:hypothetical protein
VLLPIISPTDTFTVDWKQRELEELQRKGKSVTAKLCEILEIISDTQNSLGFQKDPRDVVAVCQDNGFYLFE